MDRAAKKAAVLARRDELSKYGSRKALAAKLGISPKTISRWLKEATPFSKYREWPEPMKPLRPPTDEEVANLLPGVVWPFGKPGR
jgi:hypothetical protein